MAQRLSGEPDAELILSKLCRDHFFTSRHLGTPPYYQFHQLFRNFLLYRGSQQIETEQLIQVRQHAAQILVGLGQIDDAIDLYLSAGAWQPAIELLYENFNKMEVNAHHQTEIRWLDRLPETLFDQNPLLRYYQATCRFMGDPIGATPIYKQALAKFKKFKDEAGIAKALEGIASSLASDFQ